MNGWSVFAYIIIGATALGFVASAGPALAGNAALTKTLGLTGCIIGAVVGVVVGIGRRFK